MMDTKCGLDRHRIVTLTVKPCWKQTNHSLGVHVFLSSNLNVVTVCTPEHVNTTIREQILNLEHACNSGVQFLFIFFWVHVYQGAAWIQEKDTWESIQLKIHD